METRGNKENNQRIVSKPLQLPFKMDHEKSLQTKKAQIHRTNVLEPHTNPQVHNIIKLLNT